MSSDFAKELAALINKHSLENDSDTPDFLLADYLNHCLAIFGGVVKQRDKWNARQVTRAELLNVLAASPTEVSPKSPFQQSCDSAMGGK